MRCINHSYKFEGHLIIFGIFLAFALTHSEWHTWYQCIQKTNEKDEHEKAHTSQFFLSHWKCDERMNDEADKTIEKNIDRSTHLLFVDVVVAANVQVHTEKCSQSVLRQSRVLSTKPYVLGKLFFWRGRKKQSKNNTRIML